MKRVLIALVLLVAVVLPARALDPATTTGFTTIACGPGPPTGTPALINRDTRPTYWDTVGLQLYVWTGGAWHKVGVDHPPSGPAGGDLGGTYPNPIVLNVGNVTSGVLQVANGGTGVAVVSSNRAFLSPRDGSTNAPGFRPIDAADVTGVSVSGDLAGSLPNPTVSTVGGVYAATIARDLPTDAQKDALVGTSGTPSSANKYVTDGDSRNTNSRTPIVHHTTHQNGGSDEIATAIAAANAIPKADGFAKLDSWITSQAVAATPSLRTLGTGATDACAGNDSRLSDSRSPNGSAGGDLSGSYPNPNVASVAHVSAGVLSVLNGGVGFVGSFSIGDLLVADNFANLTTLHAGTSTYVLTSNGPNTKPSWQPSTGGVTSLAATAPIQVSGATGNVTVSIQNPPTFSGETLTAPLLLPDGTSASPSGTFANDLTKGVYSDGTGVGVAVGGNPIYTFDTSGLSAKGNYSIALKHGSSISFAPVVGGPADVYLNWMVSGVLGLGSSSLTSDAGLQIGALGVGNVAPSSGIHTSTLTADTAITVPSGGTGVATFPLHSLPVGEGTSPLANKSLKDGQLLIGSTGLDPVPATLTQGTGIAVSVGHGSATVSNTGVTTITGTADEVIASVASGAVTLTTPQAIGTSSSPTFNGETLTTPLGIQSGGTGLSSIGAGGTVLTSAGNASQWSSVSVITSGSVPTTRNVNTTSPILGGGALSSDLTLSLATVPVKTGGTGNNAEPGAGGTVLASNGTIYAPVSMATITSTTVPTSRTISTTGPLAGGGALSGDLTLSITSPLPVANGGTAVATVGSNVAFMSPQDGSTAAPGFRPIDGADLTGVSVNGDVFGSLPNSLKVSGLQGRYVATTAPSQGQALSWNSTSSSWGPTTLSSPGNTGRLYYPANGTNSDLNGDAAIQATYKVASRTPSGAAESDIVITTTNSNNVYTYGQGFATAAGEPNITSLPSGTAYRYIYAKINTGSATIKTDLLQYQASGNVATTGAQTNISFTATTAHRTSGSFVTDGFTNSCLITVSGSVSNNKSFTVQTVTATDLTFISQDTGTIEAAGATITIVTKEKLLRSGASSEFADNILTLQTFLYSDSNSYSFAAADRIIFKWWAARQSGSGAKTVTISTQSVSTQSFIQTTIPGVLPVTTITGTTDQVIASASTGDVTLSLPQSINTTSSPTFTNLTLSGTEGVAGVCSFGSVAKHAVVTYTVSSLIDTKCEYALFNVSALTNMYLPDATAGKYVIHVKLIGTGDVTLVPNVFGQTIDGAATQLMLTQYKAFDLVSDGSNWWVF